MHILIKHISAGAFHCAAITREGELYTWGSNAYGNLARFDIHIQTRTRNSQFLFLIFINLCYLLEILTRETSSTLPPLVMLVDSEPSSIVLVEDFQDPFAAGATTQLSAHGHMKGQISMCVPNLWRKRRSERKKRCCRTYKVQDKVLCRVMMIECLAFRYGYIFFILSHACCSLILFIAK